MEERRGVEEEETVVDKDDGRGCPLNLLAAPSQTEEAAPSLQNEGFILRRGV